MEIILFLLVMLIVLSLVAGKWGVDSGDNIDSPEWERRRAWTGFH